MPDTTAPNPTTPLAVDEKTAADLLGLSPSSLEKDRVQGHLGVPYAKVGRRVLYEFAGLRHWLEAHKVTPTKLGGDK
jgi:hypothetical protein